MKQRTLVWDLPLRVFHWSLALFVGAAIVTAELGGDWMLWHGRCGQAIAALLGFRLVWGFAGSTYARFAQFLPTPGSIRAYLLGQWHGEGHNPVGALAVFTLLGLCLAQVVTGVFASDDIAYSGPLAPLVRDASSIWLGGIHHEMGEWLLPLISLHIGAIFFYGHVRKQKLLKPMLTGWKDEGDGESASGGGLVALIIALMVAAGVFYLVSGGWLPEPVATAPAAVPAW